MQTGFQIPCVWNDWLATSGGPKMACHRNMQLPLRIRKYISERSYFDSKYLMTH